jgi:hypothetical protein
MFAVFLVFSLTLYVPYDIKFTEQSFVQFYDMQECNTHIQ